MPSETAARLGRPRGVKSVISEKDGSKLYVANTGPACPLRAENKGKDAGRFDFTEYGTDFHITPPGNAVDLDQTS